MTSTSQAASTRSLDASARQVLDLMANSGHPAIEDLPVPEARVAARMGFIAMQAPKVEVREVRDLQVQGADGMLPARLYRPGDAAIQPALIYFHGGGFTIGDLELYDAFCRRQRFGLAGIGHIDDIFGLPGLPDETLDQPDPVSRGDIGTIAGEAVRQPGAALHQTIGRSGRS